jgi:branched-chain amino acid transport system ATP-binding protein
VLLEVEDIHTYYGRSHVLHGVSIAVNDGEVVALLGRNGAGKTTTLRSIAGLTPPARGVIRFHGEAISGERTHRIARRGIAYVPETRDPFLYLSVEENLRLAARKRSAFSYEQVLDWFPALKHLLRRKGSQISGGEQQMLAIGRGLLTGPKLLLLDEPSQGLAPVIVNTVTSMLQDLKRQALSVVIVEQNLKMALELADRIYVMDSGRIVMETTPGAVSSDPSIVEQYIGVAAH